MIGSAEPGGRFRLSLGGVGVGLLRDGGVGGLFIMWGGLVTVGVLDR